MLRFLRGLLLLFVCCLAAPVTGLADDELSPDQFFDKHVQPILAANCFKCHGAEAKIKGSLKLTNQAAVLAGGDSGPAIDEDDPDASPFVSAINYQDYEMPPSGKLPADQIAILTKWAKLGAPWSKQTEDFGFQGETEEAHGPPQVNAENKSFWSYQPIKRSVPPEVKAATWVANPIDAFVLSKLEANGLTPNGPADKSKLLRRAHYDLTGLPPSPAEVAAFVADESEDAYERLLDKLLNSRHYGERWGRHWLDLVRYAESNSFERDGAKPHIWRYRDYVIDSFNEDKPYDQFVREQLAGDEVDEVTPATYVATGFYRLGQWDDEPTDQLQADFDGLDDVVATTSQVFLGMTVNCARCHDHKIDPIPQTDYYSMLSFFRGVKPYGHRRLDPSNTPMFDTTTGEIVDRKVSDDLNSERRELEKIVQKVENRTRKKLSNPEREDFAFEDNRLTLIREKKLFTEAEIDEYEAAAKKLKDVRSQHESLNARTLTAFGVSESGSEPPATHVMIRGNANVLGKEVSPAFPSILDFPPPEKIEPSKHGTSGRRLELANWITNKKNPLTARVIVNRLWQHHFGRGIVETPNDFGFQGAAPTHPQLLDWLAAELMDGDWKLKRMHKLLMMSNTYRLSSAGAETGLAKDIDNKLIWRMNMRRLSAEEIRDSLLAANGTLNLKAGGPSIYPEIPASVLASQSRPGHGWGKSSPEDAARRSVYIHVKRSLVTPILASFDVADTDFSCPVRFATTQSTQALGMMNSEFLNEQAALFAKRIKAEAGKSLKKQVAHALRLTMSREPSQEEVRRGVKFIRQLKKQEQASDEVAMNQFCLIALNLNEFIYID